MMEGDANCVHFINRNGGLVSLLDKPNTFDLDSLKALTDQIFMVKA